MAIRVKLLKDREYVTTGDKVLGLLNAESEFGFTADEIARILRQTPEGENPPIEFKSQVDAAVMVLESQGMLNKDVKDGVTYYYSR